VRFAGIFVPVATEQDLNNKTAKPVKIDRQHQFELACAAFTSNQVIVLIDEEQATELDQEVLVMPDTKVTFLRLVPLVGG
jgi:hypothetical protein